MRTLVSSDRQPIKLENFPTWEIFSVGGGIWLPWRRKGRARFVRRQCIMKQMSFWCGNLKETSINPVFYFESGRTRTCNQTVMSGRLMIAPIDFPPDLMMFGRVCCVSLRSFLVRNWCGYGASMCPSTCFREVAQVRPVPEGHRFKSYTRNHFHYKSLTVPV